MSPALLLFAVGGLLLVTGLLGGGFEMRELKVPQVGRVARTLATAAGVACILLGIGMVSELPTPTPPHVEVTHSPTPEPGPVRFSIRDQLGDYQVSEVVSVIVDGHQLPDLTVTESDRDMTIDTTVDAPGRHDYVVSVSTLEIDDQGDTYQVNSNGQGSITVKEGASFALGYSDDDNDRTVMLVEE